MIRDLVITSLETITAFDVVTGAYKFTLDQLQSATIANTQETEDITGKKGRKISTLKKNKGVTVSGTNGMISSGLLDGMGISLQDLLSSVLTGKAIATGINSTEDKKPGNVTIIHNNENGATQETF